MPFKTFNASTGKIISITVYVNLTASDVGCQSRQKTADNVARMFGDVRIRIVKTLTRMLQCSGLLNSPINVQSSWEKIGVWRQGNVLLYSSVDMNVREHVVLQLMAVCYAISLPQAHRRKAELE